MNHPHAGVVPDRFGGHRVIMPHGCLPQQAEKVDPSLPLFRNELLIEVESLNIDSASFHQISESCNGDLEKMKTHISELVERRGKQHNPVTGSGGMLIGKVTEVGPDFPQSPTPVRVGDRIATLVSLTLTPLKLKRILKIDPATDRVDVEGHAILFASGVFAKLPIDLPEKLSLAVLDVAGAPAQTERLLSQVAQQKASQTPNSEEQTVLVIGGGGKSGLLCLYQAKKRPGVKTIAVDYSPQAIARLRSLSFVDHVIQADARDAIAVMGKVSEVTEGRMADLVINVANIPETELSCILSVKPRGTVYYFSMATSFTRAALGAEGVGADVTLMIGNGYAAGHADLTLQIVRESKEIRDLFTELYCNTRHSGP